MANTYSSKSIANYFLERAWKDGVALTHMQVQKLVYFAHGWTLGIRKHALLDERVEAWKFGPVVPSLWHEFKEFGATPIDRFASDLDFSDDGEVLVQIPKVNPNDAETISLLERIWKVYGAFSANRLSAATHELGGPWDVTVKKFPNVRSQDIEDSLIQKHFADKAAANNARRSKS